MPNGTLDTGESGYSSTIYGLVTAGNLTGSAGSKLALHYRPGDYGGTKLESYFGGREGSSGSGGGGGSGDGDSESPGEITGWNVVKYYED